MGAPLQIIGIWDLNGSKHTDTEVLKSILGPHFASLRPVRFLSRRVRGEEKQIFRLDIWVAVVLQ